MPRKFSSADLDLARRIEATDAASVSAMARALAQTCPNLGAAAEPACGGYAVFGGVGSPMTHAMGIGMSGPVEEAEFDRMEAFFRTRGSPSLIDLCPMADPTVIRYVQERTYRVIEFNNILVRGLEPGDPFPALPPRLSVQKVRPEQDELWSRLVARGFLEKDDVPDEFLAMMSSVRGIADAFLAFLDGQPAGGGAAGARQGLASFYGDSTLVAARGQGIQRALIEHRLAHFARTGCDLAAATVIPGSASHRNYDRCGFQLIYMRVNLMREW
jgi:GNAT superfamily N-acetyltransferase